MTRSDAVESREIIIREATRLFVEHGFHGISMRQIAEAVGMSKAGLYYHFKDKEALLLATLTANMERIETAVVEACQRGGSVRDRTYRAMSAIFEQTPNQRAIIRLASQVLGQINPDTRLEFGHIYHGLLIEPIDAALREGVASGEIEPVDTTLATWMLLGMAFPFFYACHELSQHPSNRAVDLMIDIFFDGLAASGE